MIAIKTIILNNFRNYKNAEVNIVPRNGVNFIYGDNGGGKSTLMNAVNWALYGDIVFHSVDKNTEVKPSWADTSAVTEVKILLEYNGKTYQLRRHASGRNNVGDLEIREIEENGNAGRSLQLYEINTIIKGILPDNIRNLFFLSENFSNEILGHKSSNSLKANIYRISEIDTITNAIGHLNLAEDVLTKNLNKAAKNKARLDEAAEIIKEGKTKILENQKGIEEAKDKIAEKEADLEKLREALLNSKQTRELVQRRDRTEQQIKDYDSAISRNELNITDLLQKNYPKVLLADLINEYRHTLERAREEGEIPAPISPKIIAQSKRDRICACCGREITDAELKFMDEQKEKYEKIDKLKFLSDGIGEFADLNQEIEDVYYNLQDLIEERDVNKGHKNELKKELDQISEKIDDASVAQLIDNPETRRLAIERSLVKWRNRQEEYGRNIVDWKKEIEKAERERTRLIGSVGGESGSLAKELDKIGELQQLLGELREETEDIIRERIVDGVWETYTTILPDTQFKNLDLDDNYIFTFTDVGGFESSVGKLSVGEAKTLALALVSTLSSDIGYSDTPLFIDNLFAGIETSHFQDITNCVESLADKKQIFITYLYKDEGMRVSKYFAPDSINQEIKVTKKDDGICRVEEGI